MQVRHVALVPAGGLLGRCWHLDCWDHRAPACAPWARATLGGQVGRGTLRIHFLPHPLYSVALTVTDIYGQTGVADATLHINPVPDPTAVIVGGEGGGPIAVVAGAAASLSADGSLCTTGDSCNHTWVVACPGKPVVRKIGARASVTAGTAVADISMVNTGNITCNVTLRVDALYGLDHSAHTTLEVLVRYWQ